MSFNPENYNRIRTEFEHKRLRAERAALERKEDLEEKFPDIARIDAEIAKTGSMIIDAVMNHPEDLDKRLEKLRQRTET